MADILMPTDLIESIAEMQLPARSERRLQQLMNQSNEDQITPEEKSELNYLVELSELISPLRARALQFLGRRPGN